MKQYIKTLIIILLPFLLSGCFPTIFTGTAGSVMELAKDRKVGDTLTDVRISTAIKGEFIKKNFRLLYSKIQVEVVQGRVLFTGVISKEEDAITAVQIAWNQEGVTEVINELKLDKNNGNFDLVQYTRDTLITSQIKSTIFMNRDIKFVNYTVITINDIVYLFGLARSEEELERVATIASNVHRVQKVVSHVRVQKLARKIKTTVGDSETPDAHNGKEPGSEFLIDQGDDINLDDGIGGDW